MILFPMRAGLGGRHSLAPVTIEVPVDLKRFDQEGLWGNLVKDVMSFQGAVVATNSGVVPADDQMGRAVVLAEDSVEQSLARPCIAHLQRITTVDDPLLGEIVFHEGIDAPHPYLRR